MLSAGIDSDWVNADEHDELATADHDEAFVGIRTSHDFGISMMMDDEEWVENDSRVDAEQLEQLNEERSHHPSESEQTTAVAPMMPLIRPQETDNEGRSPIVAEESVSMPSLMEEELEDEDCEEVCVL